MRQGTNSRRGRTGRPNNGKRSFSQGGGNRSLESNGPNVKLRGTAVQVYDKYLTLARDATSSGDRVAAENYFQHAEHYFRMMNVAKEEAAARTNGDGRSENRNDGRNHDGGDGRSREGGRNRRSNGHDQEPLAAGDAEPAPGNGSSPPASDGGDDDPAGSDETIN